MQGLFTYIGIVVINDQFKVGVLFENKAIINRNNLSFCVTEKNNIIYNNFNNSIALFIQAYYAQTEGNY